MWAVLGNIVVSVGPQAIGRVEGSRQLVEGNRAMPLVLAAPAGRWHEPLAALAHRHAAGKLVTNVAVDVRIDQVHRWRPPAARSGAELVPGRGTANFQQR